MSTTATKLIANNYYTYPLYYSTKVSDINMLLEKLSFIPNYVKKLFASLKMYFPLKVIK